MIKGNVVDIEFGGMKDEIKEKFNEVLDSGMYVLSDQTKKFEESFASFVGKRYGIAVSTDTAALEIILRVLRERALNNGEYKRRVVLIPANGFHSIVHVMDRIGLGLEPVFVDIYRERNINVCVKDIRELVDDLDGTVLCFVAMPTAGYPLMNIEEIKKCLSSVGAVVVGDNAHAHGAMTDKKDKKSLAGAWEDISGFSFFATKVITTGGEGGIIVTDDKKIADECRIYRNYGRGGDFGSSMIIRDSCIRM